MANTSLCFAVYIIILRTRHRCRMRPSYDALTNGSIMYMRRQRLLQYIIVTASLRRLQKCSRVYLPTYMAARNLITKC